MTDRPEVVRICVLGAESTGTTTLAGRLAGMYQEPCVDEYAREYTHANGRHGSTDWTVDEIRRIAEEQARREDEACEEASRLLVCDTDAFTVAVWHERLVGHSDPHIQQLAQERLNGDKAIALYLLTAPDFPFEQDRIRGGEHLRESMHEHFVRRLDETGRPWALMSGDLNTRVANARRLIAQKFGIEPA